MQKRGVSQMDWVISLAIFLLYIAWFFLFIRPMAVQQGTPNLISNIKDKMAEEAYWTVLKYPIFIRSDFNFSKEPVIVDTDFENQFMYYMPNRAFFLLSGKLFFIGNVYDGTTIENIISSNETYDFYNQQTDLIATQDYAYVQNMQLELENNKIKTAEFDGPRILSYQLYSNNFLIEYSNSSFVNYKIAAIYPINTQILNATTMVFGYNPRIYTLFDGHSSVSQKIGLDKYDNYFLSNANHGSLSPGGCYNGNSEILSLYSGDSVMLFLFSSPADLSFCVSNYSMSLDINFDLGGQLMQKIIFYNGDYADYQKYANPYSASLGVPEPIMGLSFFNMQLLNVTNYQNLKSRWGVGDFRVTITNLTNNQNIFEFGGTPYDTATVYAEDSRDFILDKYANLYDVKISLQGWT